MHRTTSRFRDLLASLPESVQKVAEKNFKLLQNNPSHPSLHFKKIGAVWSVRAGIHHRALAIEDGPDFIWIWIGSHDEYERIVGQQK